MVDREEAVIPTYIEMSVVWLVALSVAMIVLLFYLFLGVDGAFNETKDAQARSELTACINNTGLTDAAWYRNGWADKNSAELAAFNRCGPSERLVSKDGVKHDFYNRTMARILESILSISPAERPSLTEAPA